MQQSEWQKERTMLIRKQEQFCKDKGYPMFAPLMVFVGPAIGIV